MEGNTAAFKQKAKLKGSKKEDKDKNLKGKIGKGKGKEVVLNYAKFEGQGLSYKAKLFGFVEVPGPRGDQSSVQAIQKLKQQAKQMKKDANEHKLKIFFNVTLQGVRLINEKTQTIEHEHPIHKISFISHDPEDRHVFGYIYSPPRSAANAIRKYYLYAIKSDKSADVITAQLYELFQVVYKMQESRKALNKDNATVKQRQHEKASQPLEPLQDKMLLEMSNKIGGDQQQYPTDEHLYAEPTFVKPTSSEPPSGYAIPIDQPFQTSNTNESNDYQVPRQQDEISERERQDIATAIALSLSMKENSQPFTESVTTPTNDDSAFEAVFNSTVSFPKEEISSQNTFHAEFPPFENGFTSSEEFKSGQDVSESFNDSEKLNVLGTEEIQIPDVKQVNAFGDVSSPTNTKADFETSQNRNTSMENEVIPSSEPLGEVTPISIEMKDMSSDSTEIELQPVVQVVKEIPPANSTIEKFSPFESEKQHDSDATNVETGTSTPATTSNSIAQTSFEVNFETENEDEKSSTPNQEDLFVFNANSDAFSDQDPFASTGPTEFDQSAFGIFPDNDPFSPNGVSNIDTNSNPFAENDNPFSADFSDVPANNFERPNASIPDDETSSENDRDSNKDEDIFEAMFEAKLEGKYGNETLSKNENEKEELNIEESQVVFDFEQSNHNTNTELENQDKEINQTTEEVQTPVTLPDRNTTEPDEDESLNTLNKEILEDHHDETNKEHNVNEEDTFDFSLDDVYVTLASSVPPPQSPIEFSPPPLPPRPIIPKEPIDTFISPKIPPALPPRPAINQPPHTETNIRKPPELPPRPDLEGNGSVENELVDAEQEPVSFSNESASPMFQANFDTFDFDDIENNSPVKSVGTPTAGFDCNDPLKDPFAGADPFQTPIAGDPFASSTSFDAGAQQDSDDPFSGDDPFAMTPAFDASFGSPFHTNVQSSNELDDDKHKDQFADFSTAFT